MSGKDVHNHTVLSLQHISQDLQNSVHSILTIDFVVDEINREVSEDT